MALLPGGDRGVRGQGVVDTGASSSSVKWCLWAITLRYQFGINTSLCVNVCHPQCWLRERRSRRGGGSSGGTRRGWRLCGNVGERGKEEWEKQDRREGKEDVKEVE